MISNALKTYIMRTIRNRQIHEEVSQLLDRLAEFEKMTKPEVDMDAVCAEAAEKLEPSLKMLVEEKVKALVKEEIDKILGSPDESSPTDGTAQEAGAGQDAPFIPSKGETTEPQTEI